MSDHLPQWPLQLLRRVCPEHLREEIEGDLEQQFYRDIKKHGVQQAKKRSVLKALSFIRPGIILRNKFSIEPKGSFMLRNYITIMLRNLRKHKAYAAIHTFGLTAGMCFALLIGIFSWSELQVNQNLADADRLFILECRFKNADESVVWFAPAPLVKETVAQYPTLFEQYYRFWDRQITVSKADKHFRIQSMIGDSTFLNIFGFPVLHGDASTALENPNSIAITEKTARQFFNRADVVGESLTLTTEINGKKDFLITAVLKDLEKKNSVSDFMNMDAQIFLPLSNRTDFTLSDPLLWTSDIINYVKLTPTASVTEASAAINTVLTKNMSGVEVKERSLKLDALSDYYLVTNNGAVKKLIISLIAIVGFILTLAICNFINITIGNSFSRLKEIGVRKVVGGLKKQVVLQFLTESIVLSGIAAVLSLVFYEISRSYSSTLLDSALPSVLDFNIYFWLIIGGSILFVGLLAGFYPAFYLSQTRTIESLKGKFRSVKSTIRFSRGLITAQFLIAGFVFIAALIMSKQVSFFLEKDLGYDRSAVLVVTSVPRMWNEEGFLKMKTARDEFRNNPRIENVSLSWGAPGNMSPMSAKLYAPGQPVDDGLPTTITCADEAYGNVYSFKLIEGEFLSAPNEERKPFSLVLNESAKKSLKVNVGDKLKLEFWGDVEFTVTGIIKDFNFESLHTTVKPLAFMHNRDFNAYRYFSFKLQPGDLVQSVSEVEKQWKTIFPDDPFVYGFVDDKIQVAYKMEYQLKKASGIASVLMLVIVLTGIVGLTSLSLSKRTKEIGIRKVLGASVSNILVLMSREYIVLIVLSFVVGIPLAYWFIQQWLESFAYQIELSWWMFAVPELMLLGVTVLVIAFQCLRTAVANPSKALRYE
jgi:putative ABC transport system permease protein